MQILCTSRRNSSSTGNLNITSEAFTGSGPYALSHAPNGRLTLVFFDGILQPSTNYEVTGSSVSLTSAVDPALFTNVAVTYSY